MKRFIRLRLLKTCLLSGLVSFVASRGLADDFGFQDLSVGTRGGLSFNGNTDRFRQIEAFADLNLPWHWNFYSDWSLQPFADFSAGWLEGEHANAAIGSLGPALELRRGTFPLTLVGGSSPTLLSRHDFGNRDFGDDFQFTSYIGLNWDITRNISLGWRFQHMSNAGISKPNPGLNMQMISLSYRF